MDVEVWCNIRLEALQLAHRVLDDSFRHEAVSPEEVLNTAKKFVEFIVNGK